MTCRSISYSTCGSHLQYGGYSFHDSPVCRKATDILLLLLLVQISATAMRTATMRAKMDTSKTAQTPARSPRPRRTGRITRRAQLRGTPSVTVTLPAGSATAALGLREARQTRGRAPSPSSPVPPALEKTSRARPWTSPKRTSAGQ